MYHYNQAKTIYCVLKNIVYEIVEKKVSTVYYFLKINQYFREFTLNYYQTKCISIIKRDNHNYIVV